MLQFNTDQESGMTSLQKACLFYGPTSTTLSLVSENAIEFVDGIATIKEGKVMNEKALRKMAHSILNIKTEPLSLIDPFVLAQQENRIVWWMPSGTQRIFFKTTVRGLENCNEEVEHPSLLFARKDKTWMVLAFAGTTRPTADTPLLFSPYFNVFDNHVICEGSTRLPKTNAVHEWTSAFFESAFTHENFRSKQSKIKRKGGRPGLWRDLVSRKITTFPTDCLPAAGITVSQFLKGL